MKRKELLNAKYQTSNIKPALEGTVEYLPFKELPLHDSTWGLCTGADGNIYIGACGENTGGLSVFILRYRPETRELEYLIEVGPEVGEPPDNGHATQAKIHYCLLPGSDGLLYCATHASGPPWGDPIWRPWNCWDDTKRLFPGSHIFTFNPKTNRLQDFGVGPVKEGSRALALDEKRLKIYGITWPRNHLYVYYLDSHRYLDLGRFGDINPQAIFLDRQGNAYTTDDYGYLLRVDADTNQIRKLAVKCPHVEYRQGWHNVPYDVVPAPDRSCFYGTDWGYESYLWKFNPYVGKEGTMESFGRAFGPADFSTVPDMQQWEVRGLVFGMDEKLYFTMRLGWEKPEETWILRFDPGTLKKEKVCSLRFGNHQPEAVASATQDFYGNLYFAEAGNAPTAIYIYRPNKSSLSKKVFSWKDIKQWG